MPEIRHQPTARTLAQVLPGGGGVDLHRHDDNQICYAARGVLSVRTATGRWIAPGTRAIWVPAGAPHEHRAYGQTELHTVGLPADVNPLGLDSPAVLAVGPLLRELIRTMTSEYALVRWDCEPAQRRLGAVLLDQLRQARQQPIRLPTPRDPAGAAVCPTRGRPGRPPHPGRLG